MIRTIGWPENHHNEHPKLWWDSIICKWVRPRISTPRTVWVCRVPLGGAENQYYITRYWLYDHQSLFCPPSTKSSDGRTDRRTFGMPSMTLSRLSSISRSTISHSNFCLNEAVYKLKYLPLGIYVAPFV